MHSHFDEARRLDILRRYAILDTPPEPLFDRIAWLAAAYFGTPIATVTFVDETRQWFKAIIGADLTETSRDVAFCHHTIRQDEVMVVPDALLDERFATNPLVTGGPGIRFYAGAPLCTHDGFKLGTVAVIDSVPHPDLSPDQKRFLAELARMVVNELEIRLAAGDVATEIVRRRNMEADLRRSNEALAAALKQAERANAAKSRFLAAASHDLRQPMQSLVLLLAVLREKLIGQPVIRVVNATTAAADAMRGLLDDLLDVARIDAGLVRSNPLPTRVGDLLARLAEEYRPRAQAKGLELRLRDCGGGGMTDPTLLERILRNLLENALRYTACGGILLACTRLGDRLRVAVIDTGIGMTPEDSETIFEEFVQLANPERDRAKGLGLGLAIVHRLSSMLGHHVQVSSRLGRGSRFYLDMPLVQPPARSACPSQGARRLCGRVLVIDDERMVLDALGNVLINWGLDVVTADSACEGVAKLGNRPPDAILADYRLRNGRTGVDAVRTVQDRFGAPIPALIITGDTSPERLVEAEASGHVLLHKPVAAEELRRGVEAVLRH